MCVHVAATGGTGDDWPDRAQERPVGPGPGRLCRLWQSERLPQNLRAGPGHRLLSGAGMQTPCSLLHVHVLLTSAHEMLQIRAHARLHVIEGSEGQTAVVKHLPAEPKASYDVGSVK